MSNNEIKEIEKIRNEYTERKATKFDELKALNREAELPADIFAYTFGTASSLVLGTGMCLAMKMIGATLPFAMPLGIAIGLLGIAGVSANYFIHKKLLKSRKKAYSDKILKLSDELLGAQELNPQMR